MANDWLSSTIGAIGTLGTGLLGGMFSGHSAYKQYQYQKGLMAYQASLNYKYGKKSALNQYGWQRQGLENAGYNPLLALGGAEGVANTGWTTGGQAPNPDYQSAITNALSFAENARQNKISDANIKNVKADTKTKEIQQGLLGQQIVNQVLQNSYFEREKQSQIAVNNAEQFLKLASMQEIIERTKWIAPSAKAQIENLLKTGQASIISSNSSAYDIYSNHNSMVQQQKDYNKWADKHPILKSIDQTLTRYLSPASSAAGGYFAGKKAPVKNGLKKPLGFR